MIGSRRLEERPTLRLVPRRSRWSNGASWNGSGRLFSMSKNAGHVQLDSSGRNLVSQEGSKIT